VKRAFLFQKLCPTRHDERAQHQIFKFCFVLNFLQPCNESRSRLAKSLRADFQEKRACLIRFAALFTLLHDRLIRHRFFHAPHSFQQMIDLLTLAD